MVGLVDLLLEDEHVLWQPDDPTRLADVVGFGLLARRLREVDRYREAAARAQRQARGLLAPPPQQQARPATWKAVPTTLPTYVSNPKASKVPRVVDLTSPGRQWTGAAMVQRARRERQQSQLERAQLERAQQQFDREMAVLEPDVASDVEELADAAQPPVQQRPSYRRAAND